MTLGLPTLADINAEFSRPVQEARTLRDILLEFHWKPYADEYACAREVLAACGIEPGREALDALVKALRRTSFIAMASEVEAVVKELKRNPRDERG